MGIDDRWDRDDRPQTKRQLTARTFQGRSLSNPEVRREVDAWAQTPAQNMPLSLADRHKGTGKDRVLTTQTGSQQSTVPRNQVPGYAEAQAQVEAQREAARQFWHPPRNHPIYDAYYGRTYRPKLIHPLDNPCGFCGMAHPSHNCPGRATDTTSPDWAGHLFKGCWWCRQPGQQHTDRTCPIYEPRWKYLAKKWWENPETNPTTTSASSSSRAYR